MKVVRPISLGLKGVLIWQKEMKGMKETKFLLGQEEIRRESLESNMVGQVGRIQRWLPGFQPLVYKHTFTQLFNQILF